jgi:hypothetical protein
MGPVPINFEIEGQSLADAVSGFSAAAVRVAQVVCRAEVGRYSCRKWSVIGGEQLPVDQKFG